MGYVPALNPIISLMELEEGMISWGYVADVGNDHAAVPVPHGVEYPEGNAVGIGLASSCTAYRTELVLRLR